MMQLTVEFCTWLEGIVKEKRCFIVGAGSFSGLSVLPEPDDLIIAADGGYTYLKELNIEPDVLIGDFDSLELIPEHRELIRHSPLKDDTDMALAVAYAAEEGYRTFFIYGGLGGRLDHTLANLSLLNGMSKQGLESYLIGEKMIITAISEEAVFFSENMKGTISVFCMGEKATGIYEKGLKYGLEDAVMTADVTLGVSNEFIGTESSISTKTGTLVIIYDEKNGLPKERIRLKESDTNVSALISEHGWRSMHSEEGRMEETTKYYGKES